MQDTGEKVKHSATQYSSLTESLAQQVLVCDITWWKKVQHSKKQYSSDWKPNATSSSLRRNMVEEMQHTGEKCNSIPISDWKPCTTSSSLWQGCGRNAPIWLKALCYKLQVVVCDRKRWKKCSRRLLAGPAVLRLLITGSSSWTPPARTDRS